MCRCQQRSKEVATAVSICSLCTFALFTTTTTCQQDYGAMCVRACVDVWGKGEAADFLLSGVCERGTGSKTKESKTIYTIHVCLESYHPDPALIE